jgi:hypothetical protein
LACCGGHRWSYLFDLGEVMNKEMQKVIEALIATVTVMLKDGDTAVRWLSYNLPQKEKQDETN